jgi:uncharacterized protein YbjT (DUF2867 family)
MHVLVTAGSGVADRATITALLQRGHVIHLLSRDARRQAEEWSHGVHPIPADLTEADAIAGAADQCEVVLHLASIMRNRDGLSIEKVNVDGTRNVIREAERAGVKRFIYLSSLGVETGPSEYHHSKRGGELLVKAFAGDWVIVRSGNVYGPRDEHISRILHMVRTLPALPTSGRGDEQFQPVWHEDLAEALATLVDRGDLSKRVLEVAGIELTSQNDLVARLSVLTQRNVTRVEVPDMLARAARGVASLVGINSPFDQLRRPEDGHTITAGAGNALIEDLHLTPTPLDTGLRKLCDAQDELLPSEGVGPLRRKRYWADITQLQLTPETLMDTVRRDFRRFMASFIDVKAAGGDFPVIETDATITFSIPVRGQMQLRVAENEPRVLTMVSVAGHPLAGAVRFLSEQRGEAIRFEVQLFDRAASLGDLVVMRTIGEPAQDAAWRETIEKIVRESGGVALNVLQETESLDRDQADRIDEWVRDLVVERRREQAAI